MGVFNKGDIVFYKDLQGNLTTYKIVTTSYNKDKDQIEYKIIEVGARGKRSKTFNTTVRNKKREVRLFKSWLQPKDVVLVKNSLRSVPWRGFVDVIYVDKYADGTTQIKISVLNSSKQETLFTLEEATNTLELVQEDGTRNLAF